LAAAALFVVMVDRHALKSPSNAGYKTIAELKGFREFLARADADRLDCENSPGRSLEIQGRMTPSAGALNVERRWGEEPAGNLLELGMTSSS
jgi:hypothetical protein